MRGSKLPVWPALVGALFLLASSCGQEPGNGAPPDTQPGATEEVRSAIGGPATIFLNTNFYNPSGEEDYVGDLVEILSEAKAVAGAISTFVGGVNAAVVILQFLQFLDPPVDEVALLTQDVNAIGTGITWQNVQTYIDQNYGPILGAIVALQDHPATLFDGSNDDVNSKNGVINLGLDAAWTRTSIGSPNDSSTDGATFKYTGYSNYGVTGPFSFIIPNGWKGMITARPATSSMNLVMDWRLGVPFLLKAISLRLLVMGAIHPNFRLDHSYDAEIRNMHDVLLTRYQTMSDGVQCVAKDFTYGQDATHSYEYTCQVACADIYTGMSSQSSFVPAPSYPVNGMNLTAKCSTVQGTKAYDDTLNSTAAFVRSKMPLFEMRSMIDVLYRILHPDPDLTVNDGEIRSQGQSSLCASAAGGSLGLATCNGSPEQRWTYDRESGLVSNPVLNVCIDELGSVTYNSPIQFSSCSASSPGQQWTYDPEHQRLQNAFGTVMRATAFSVGAAILTDAATLWSNGVERAAAGFYAPVWHSAGDRAWLDRAFPWSPNPSLIMQGNLPASSIASGWLLDSSPDASGNFGLYKWDPISASWSPSSLARARGISVDLNGILWLVNSAGQISKWTTGNVALPFGGSFCASSVASGSTDQETWAVQCQDQTIWHWTGTAWERPQANAYAQKIAMVSTPDARCGAHFPMVIGTNSSIYFFKPTACSSPSVTGGFSYSNGFATDISTDLVVGSDGNIYEWGASSSAWSIFGTGVTFSKVGGWQNGIFMTSTAGAVVMANTTYP